MGHCRLSRPARLAAVFCCLVFLMLFGGSASIYTSGAAQKSYEKGDELMVKVNWLLSIRNQVPYSYYSLPYCRPQKFVHPAKNLEEVLFGDHSEISLFAFKMLEGERCRVVCRMKLEAKILDGLPLVTAPMPREKAAPVYQPGFLVGLTGHYVGEQEQRAIIHNHLSFIIKYNKDLYRNSTNIVGFEVQPSSVRHKYKGIWNEKTPLTTCNADKEDDTLHYISPQEVIDDEEIIFTYNVDFQESVVKWASRWDTYLVRRNNKAHWLSTLSSLVVALLLSGKVALILSRTLRRDISMHNTDLEHDETQEEIGWKAIHGDVFRPPSNANLLCICIGTGVQIFGTVMGVLILSILNFLPHSSNYGFLSTMLLLWAFMGLFAGYTSTRLHNMFQGTEQWNIIGSTTAVSFPAAIFVMFSALNALLGREKSSAALPFLTLVNLFILGYTISVPAVTIGTYAAFKMPALVNPVATTKNIPREIPMQVWYKKPIICTLLGGLISFGAISGELFILLPSIFMHLFYNSYGSLLLAFIVHVITCAVSTIIICYNQLCRENYLWWWSSFLTGASSALYFILYATYYLLVRLQLAKTVPLIVCFGYVLIAASACFLMTGCIGFLACFWFTRLIYSSLKID